jgi:ankyrin repeat protein
MTTVPDRLSDDTDFRTALLDFFISAFKAEELKPLSRRLPASREFEARLPGDSVSMLAMSEAMIAIAVERDQLTDLQRLLLAERKDRAAEIEGIWALPRREAPAKPVHTAAPALPGPQLPPGHVVRSEYRRLSAALIEGNSSVGLMGLPGSGKTTAAAAALRDERVIAAFARVCWLSWEDPVLRSLADIRRDMAAQLAGGTASQDVSDAELIRVAAQEAGGGRILVVLDDPRGLLTAIEKTVRCHPSVTLLVTLRDKAALISIGLTELIELKGLPRDAGLQVLAHWARTTRENLPDDAATLAEAIGYHPAGLRILGASAALASDANAEWKHLHQRLNTGDLANTELPGIAGTSLATLVADAVENIGEDEKALMEALSVLPAGSGCRMEMAAALTGRDPDWCRRAFDQLLRRQLANDAWGTSRELLALHPLVHLYTRRAETAFLTQFRAIVTRALPNHPLLTGAITLGDEEVAIHLAKTFTRDELNAATPQLAPPLHQASFHGMARLVDLLLDRGADRHAVDEQGFSALQYAAQAGQIEIALVLVQHGLSPYSRNKGGKDAILVALFNGQSALAEALLDASAPPAATVEEGLAQHLQFAASRGLQRIVRRLLSMGVDPDPNLGGENSPVIALAAERGDLQIVTMLLADGRGRFATAALGRALGFAAQNGHEACVRALLDAGATTSWPFENGQTALMLAGSQGHARIVDVLLEAGADTGGRDASGHSVVDYAAHFHRHEVIEVLAVKGLQVDSPGAGGVRPLATAVRAADIGATLKSSVSMNEKGGSFSQATVITDVSADAIATVRLLLSKGADVAARDDKGLTALHYAVERLQPRLVQLLLDAGADPDAPDTHGNTARTLARAPRPPGGMFVEMRSRAILQLLGSDVRPTP